MFVLLGCLSVHLIAEDDETPLDRFYDMGMALYETLAPEALLERYEPLSREDIKELWRSILIPLQSQSLEDLALHAEQAHEFIVYLRLLPGGDDYADWLEQRLDYYDMAEQATEVITVPKQTPQPKPVVKKVTSQKKVKIVVRPKIIKLANLPPERIEKTRKKYVQSTSTWEKKMKKRSRPKRADYLVPRLKKIFIEEGIPPEWVWIAEVESSMNPEARSPVGAAGLFQFMPATAKQYGMRLKPEDERLDPEKSCRAAAKYLKYLYRRFDSWPLAFAAYNAGEGRVGKLLRQSDNKSFEGIKDRLPMETQMYVPKILALVSVRESVDPQTLGPPRA